ncbi:hypothetical protein ACE2AJ_07055 [Aquihabitans daechungensis]|uniref:hypothetical protein n=1 Tax=Aquihabitans daechungensis TaxID=1052257 RepID=UPI003BA2880A
MRLPDRIWVPGLAGLLLALVFVGALLVRSDGDPSRLVHAGPPWTSAEAARGSLTVQEADQAFDGQFFYRLGVSPWSTEDEVAGVRNDLPSLRNARWGYGALAWVVSAGDPDLVPWALIAINVGAAFAVGAIGGGLARTADRHALWGALFVLWPGFAYSLSLDTSELAASALLLGGLLALRHRHWVVTAGLLTAAVITRDTTTVVPFAVALAGLWATERDDRPKQVAAGAVPLVAFATWQLVQRSRFGSLPLTSSGDNNLSAPLAGFVEQLGKVIIPSSSAEALRLVSMVGLIALLGAAAWSVARAKAVAPTAEQLAWLGSVAVVVLLNAYLWSGATAFLRASTEAGLLSILLVIQFAVVRLRGFVAAGLGALWAGTALAQLTKL